MLVLRNMSLPSLAQVRYSAMRRRYRNKWEKVLKFKLASEFAECDNCWQMKQDIADARDSHLSKQPVLCTCHCM
jgi:hypothetical protein